MRESAMDGMRGLLVATLALVSLTLSGDALGAVTFTATELLGRPTDTSVAVSVIADRAVEAYVEYGTAEGQYTGQTVPAAFPVGTPVNVEITGLQPDTRYVYRTRYREPGAGVFEAGEAHPFHTQRACGAAFSFTVQADPHLGDPNTSEDLYRVEMDNVRADAPDFQVDLGDTFMTEKYGATCADAVQDCLAHRPFFGIAGASAPLFLVNGNHEGELGWLKDGTEASLPACSTLARRKYYPCPVPGDFYTGCATPEPFVDIRDGYYAWEWGDALFVVLDPFWYTDTKPPTSRDGWSWTLGEAQYRWLAATLAGSRARFKIVFVHHLVGGLGFEARGGVEGAMLYEWGGLNFDGTAGFDSHRPGWGKPIHRLLADAGASIVFHGHDHIFVKQELDGIVYQECPRPDFPQYTDVSNAARYGYVQGLILPNSGHLRVSVAREQLTVDYVRAYLAGGGTNGEVACTYTVPSRLPLAAFEMTAPSPVSGRAVSFTDASVGNPTSWSWAFGDGATSTERNPSHVYATPGAYTVSLTVANAYGSDTETKTVDVSPACTITSVVRATSPFRLKVYGSSFLPGAAVTVNGTPVPLTTHWSGNKVVAKSGPALRAMVPTGVPVQIVVVNPDGGTSAPVLFTR
jgi:hypothetical protein